MKEDIIKEFEDIFTKDEWNNVVVNKYHQVYDLIEKLLASQKKEILEKLKEVLERDGIGSDRYVELFEIDETSIVLPSKRM